MIDINNRRYIGSKTKLLETIKDSIPESYFSKDLSFADVFAGTGVVGYYFTKYAKRVIVNDILYSNVAVYNAFFSSEEIDKKKLESILNGFNSIDPTKLKDNYFSKTYGGKYFSNNDAKIIGFIRDELERKKEELTNREYYAVLTSLLYATDKIANTCGHFESFLSKKPVDRGVKLEMPNLQDLSGCEIYNEDANKLVREIECDIAYVDPPYNARQYVNFYHVLENLASWNKPTVFEGNSMKFKRNHLKSGYSRSSAPALFKDLIDNLKCRLIVVSYNNTYDARSGASNNKITEEQLETILKSRGRVTIKEIKYKFFNAGKTDFKNHLERIYVCEVNK